MAEQRQTRRARFAVWILGPLAGVGAIAALVVCYLVVLHFVRGPTVDAGQSFTVNGTEYRVDVVENHRNGLVVAIHTRNTQHSPHSPGQAIFELAVRAGDQKVVRDCEKLGCMDDVLQPGETHTYTFQFVVKRPADSLEFVDTTNEISGRVALIRLRPTLT